MGIDKTKRLKIMESAKEILFKYPISRKEGTVSINSALEAMEEYAEQSCSETLKFAEYCSEIDYVYIKKDKMWIDQNDLFPDKTTEELYNKFKDDK